MPKFDGGQRHSASLVFECPIGCSYRYEWQWVACQPHAGPCASACVYNICASFLRKAQLLAHDGSAQSHSVCCVCMCSSASTESPFESEVISYPLPLQIAMPYSAKSNDTVARPQKAEDTADSNQLVELLGAGSEQGNNSPGSKNYHNKEKYEAQQWEYNHKQNSLDWCLKKSGNYHNFKTCRWP